MHLGQWAQRPLTKVACQLFTWTRMLGRMRLIAAAGLAACCAATSLSAQKADTVTLRNGDRIVGEIKTLDQGALTYKTDDVGTLTIKWDKVYRIVSPRYFEVEDQTGRRYYGALQPSNADGRMVVVVTSFIDTLDILNVVRIYPIGLGFWSRVDGKLNASLGFQRANKLRSFGIDIDAKHRTELRLTEVVTSTYFQSQESATNTSRNSIALSQLRFLQQRWLLTAAGQLEQNEELDLGAAWPGGAGGGRFPASEQPLRGPHHRRGRIRTNGSSAARRSRTWKCCSPGRQTTSGGIIPEPTSRRRLRSIRAYGLWPRSYRPECEPQLRVHQRLQYGADAVRQVRQPPLFHRRGEARLRPELHRGVAVLRSGLHWRSANNISTAFGTLSRLTRSEMSFLNNPSHARLPELRSRTMTRRPPVV